LQRLVILPNTLDVPFCLVSLRCGDGTVTKWLQQVTDFFVATGNMSLDLSGRDQGVSVAV